ncbi:UvrD-helicase domain-containing protein [Priestia megaterium]
MVSEIEKKVFACIDNLESFIIEAGAGSGKTWTLVQAILYVIQQKGTSFKKKNQKIGCITYTNVAKEEIISRTKANDLVEVKTIHDFLWEIVKPFQKELKQELVLLIEEKLDNEVIKINAVKNKTTKTYQRLDLSINRLREDLENLKEFKGGIKYKEFSSRRRGIISHDDVIILSNKIIRKSLVVQKIIQDTYPVIFIDEYQDTNQTTAYTLLDHLQVKTQIIFGYFGDYHQKIYEGSIGKINAEQYNLKVIQKTQNYRCSKQVIKLLNSLRSDIIQNETENSKEGICNFYYVNDQDLNTEHFIEEIIKKDFNISTSEGVKELYLVTKSIANKNGYANLHNLYDDKEKPEGRRKKRKEQILKNKDNRDCLFANFLYDIEEVNELFQQNKIQMLLKKIPYKVESILDKRNLFNDLTSLKDICATGTIREAIDFAHNHKLLIMNDKLKWYFKSDDLQDSFFQSLMNLNYVEFSNMYYTVKETSPFSTNHGTKGAEYDNVVCFINDADWRNYNLNNFFDGTDIHNNKERRYERTKNLFYVICSRARFNLAIVVLSELSEDALVKAQALFSEDAFINMESTVYN